MPHAKLDGNKQKMENVCIVSGELDRDFAEEATFNGHGGVNQSSGVESSRKKNDIRPFQRRKYLHIL